MGTCVGCSSSGAGSSRARSHSPPNEEGPDGWTNYKVHEYHVRVKRNPETKEVIQIELLPSDILHFMSTPSVSEYIYDEAQNLEFIAHVSSITRRWLIVSPVNKAYKKTILNAPNNIDINKG